MNPPMYLAHFGLREAPFSLTPDTGFFFNGAGFQEALNVLFVALESGEGFVKITGDPGTGKTLLCRKLLNTLQEGYVTAYIPNPLLSPMDLYKALADELGIPFKRDLGFQRFLGLVTRRLLELAQAGKNVVLLVDESQSLPDETLEALRLMTNLETEKHKILQVVLFGQPELDQRLERPECRQLKQRITFSYVLKGLNESELNSYISHRLQVAGYNGPPLLEAGAMKMLGRVGRGVPRVVNILCHKALMAAFGEGRSLVGEDQVRRAVADTDYTDADQARGKAKGQGLQVSILWVIAAALAGGVVALLLWK